MGKLLRLREGAMDLFDVDAFDFGHDALRGGVQPLAHAIGSGITDAHAGGAIDPDLALHELLDGAH
jgi:hypothetical protein